MTFYVIAAVVLIFAVMVITARSPIESALWLVACLIAQAALFVLLNAHLVAALQVLLYAGAITVLLLFVIMMIHLSPAKSKWRAIPGGRIIASSAVIFVAGALGSAMWMMYKKSPFAPNEAGFNGTVESVGRFLLTDYAVQFELVSILILSAIVGSVALGLKRVKE
jgi:NADH-quinone oxidoreductase subunit J